MEIVKSPFNYTGGKYKLMKCINEEIDRANVVHRIDEVWDVFGGGFNVGVNVGVKGKIVYNDIEKEVVRILLYFKENNLDTILCDIQNVIDKYELSKTNRNGYNQLRNDWNHSDKADIVNLYVLICYGFNNQIRYNKSGDYNIPFGENRASFNGSMKEKMIKFIGRLHEIDSVILCGDYSEMILGEECKERVYYCDPPYLNSVNYYTKNWNEAKERQLLNWLDRIDLRGERFILSNNIQYKNEMLCEWIEKYKVRYLNYGYENSCYSKKDKSKKFGEILITNY